MPRKEIDRLQKQVGVPAPAPLRDYLTEIGLFQDLTGWDVTDIEVYESPEEFVLARQFLADILPAKKDAFFPFGDDGAGNVFCVPATDDVPCRIHFVDHETRKVSRKKEFGDWLESVVAKVLRGIRRRPPNERKVWSVQFSFSNTSYADLAKVLRSAGRFKEIDKGWSKDGPSGAGVTATARRIELDGIPLKLGRLECKNWQGPLLSFDMDEPLQQGLKHSRIRALDALFKQKCPGYQLVDYGPLDSSELEED
jgi:hypothetical protein